MSKSWYILSADWVTQIAWPYLEKCHIKDNNILSLRAAMLSIDILQRYHKDEISLYNARQIFYECMNDSIRIYNEKMHTEIISNYIPKYQQ